MAIAEYEQSIRPEQEPSDEEFMKDLTTRLLKGLKVLEDAPKLQSNIVSPTPIFGTPKEGDTNTKVFGGNMPQPSKLPVHDGLKFQLNALNIKTDPLSKDDCYFLERVINFLVDRFKQNWSADLSQLQEIMQRLTQQN